LLQHATSEEVLLVASMSVQDWREWFKDMVMRNVALLDLVQKPWLGDSLPPAVAAAAATAVEPAAAAAAS
jgi:hypothetical protein